MALPALHLLCKVGYPLILVGRPWAKDLLTGLDPVEFIALRGGLRQDIQTLRNALSTLQQNNPAVTAQDLRGICFPDSLSSAATFRWAGVRSSGYRDDGRSLLLSWPIRKPRGPLHVVESYYHLARTTLEHWGVGEHQPRTPPRTLDLPLTSAHEGQAASVLERAGLQAGSFVLLSPTATGLHKGRIKTWPHYGELAEQLKAAGWPVVLCPPPQEVDTARAAVPGALLLPSLPLGGFAALTRQAALVICNDSGTSHVTAAAGGRQITLFGVTRPERTGPWSPHAICLGTENHWPELDEVAATALHQLAHNVQRSTPSL